MDLRSATPALNLYNRQWPLRTAGYFDAPAKLIHDEEGRPGEAFDSIISGGSIVSGGMVRNSVLGRGVRVLVRGAGGGFDHLRQLRDRPALAGPPRHSR